MMKDKYINSLSELNFIIENLDFNLNKSIPSSFKLWVQENMNKQYIHNLKTNIPLSKQKLMPETKVFIAILFRKYIATDSEKINFSKYFLNR